MLKKFEGERRKQILFFGGAILLLGGVVFLLSEMFGEKPTQEQKPPPPTVEIQEKPIQEQSIKAEFGQQILLLQKQIEELKKQQEEQQRQQQQQQALNQIFQPPPPPSQPPPPPPPPSTTAYPPTPPPKEQEQKPAMPVDLIALEKKEQTPEQKEPKEEKKEEKVRKRSVIPAGAFVKGVLLSGLDAPTGGKAQTSPHPVLIRLVDKAVLPNFWRADIKECFVVGSGYGDLSAERAYIRLEVMSCVKKDGTVMERKVSGFVAGEDGKVGLIGRVVAKQGQILARMLVAGFIEGIAKLFQQAGTTVVVSPVGGATTTTINPDDVLRTGLAGGFAEASKVLVEQYKKLADETFPVIEVNAGRDVDLVFLQGIDLTEQEQVKEEKE